jgi:hypothetical protein
MDPGLLALGALAIGASTLLPRFQKSKKEGFNVIPANNYPSTAAQAQAMYNEFTLASDPREETQRVANLSPQEQQNYRAAVNTALTSPALQSNPNAIPTVTTGTNQNPVYIPDPNALLQRIAYCENKPINDNVFSDPQFARDCGVCLTKGTRNNQQGFEGKKGLFVSETDRQNLLEEKSMLGSKFNKGKPTHGYCEGATQGAANSHTFALDRTELLAYQKRLQCKHEKSLTGECAVCLADGQYTYLGRPDQLAYDTVKFFVGGLGKLEISIAGNAIDLAPPQGIIRTLKIDLSTTLRMIPAYVKEGDIMVFSVSVTGSGDGPTPTPGELYGYLEAPISDGGVFQVPLEKVLITDEITNSAPRRARQLAQLRTENGEIFAAKMLTRFGKNSMVLTGTLPFLFAGNTEFQGIDCTTSILQSKPSSVERFGGDPCYKPSTQKQGSWTDACLKDRVQTFGCTADGDLFKNPEPLRTLPMPGILNYVQNLASKQFSDNASSKACNGKNISTPCDPFIVYNVDDSPAMTKECVRYLYYNEGAENPSIGSTYTGPVNTFFSLNNKNKRIYCLPGAGLDIDRNPRLLDTYERLARNGYRGRLGLKAIQTYIDEHYRRATNTGLNANLPDNRGGRGDAIAQCFQTLANVPDNVLPAANLPNAQFLRVYYPAGRRECLQISQIAVFDNRGQNVAFGRNTRAANTWANGRDGAVPSRAVDGQLRARSHPFEYHSQCLPGDFWEVDFNREYPIRQVNYYNRADCCSTRSTGMILELQDKNRKAVWQATLRGGLPVESFSTFARQYNI